ncbi:MAG: class I SAM-dependent rRNA methyltransferase [Brevinematia bacterium]
MQTIGEVFLKKKAEKRVRNFYLWVYKDDIKKLSFSGNREGWVSVLTEDGDFICKGFYSPDVSKPVKVFSYDRNVNVDIEVKKRILFSFEMRRKLGFSGVIDSENFRVVYSESDFLPGLIIDKYEEFVGIQLRNRLFESLRDVVVDSIVKFIEVENIYERSYGEAREEEEKLQSRNVPVKGRIPELIRIRENGLQFVFDPFKGQKTGFFLDQSVNREIVAGLCSYGMKVLDVFSYVGGFGIYCAKKGAKVVCIEKNEYYSDLIRENSLMNDVKENVSVVVGDAFEKVKEVDDRFDLIILDPPTFVKSLSESRKRLPAFISLIKSSLSLLKPEGKLIVFTCSYNLLKEHFVAAIRIAGMELGVRLRIERELLQSPDHPWILQMPETLYLRGFIVSKLPKF